MADRIRVVLADDHAVLRAGLKMLINSQADMEVSGEASDGREAVRMVCELKPDVAVMDIAMPAGGGIKAIESVRQKCPQTRVLVLTMHDDAAYVRTAISAGASGYVAKRAADTELLRGIRTVWQGRPFVDPTLAASVVTDVLAPREASAPRASDWRTLLSERERQVLDLLIRGYTNQQIADRLFLSVKTTETYRARITKKLGLRDRADLVRFGVENELLKPGDEDTKSALT